MMYPKRNVRIIDNEIWMRQSYVRVYGGFMAILGIFLGVMIGLFL